MNPLEFVVKTELRIEKLINADKVAMIASDAIFKKYKKYQCKVLSIFFFINHNQDVHVRVHTLSIVLALNPIICANQSAVIGHHWHPIQITRVFLMVFFLICR